MVEDSSELDEEDMAMITRKFKKFFKKRQKKVQGRRPRREQVENLAADQ